MGKLTYGMMMSLDGFLADASRYFDGSILKFINDEMRRHGTEIYGRRMYEDMLYWETYEGQNDGSSEHADEFARLWKGLDKLVISSTLERVSSDNTRLARALRMRSAARAYRFRSQWCRGRTPGEAGTSLIRRANRCKQPH